MKKKILLLFLITVGWPNLYSVSIVYNFRIAQITKQQIFEKTNQHFTLVTLFFDQFLKKHTGEHQNYLGGLESFIYNFESYYFRTDFAVSNISEDNCISKFSDTQTDDILFSFGKNFTLNRQSKITLTGLFGIPTHKLFVLQKPNFGFSQFGIGAQVDGSYAFNNKNSLLFGARYIHFIPRNTIDCDKNIFKFTSGNLADILVASKNNWGKHHGLEFGYTAKFNFGADICPKFDDIIKKTNYIRSNYYLVYKYKFIINNVSNRLLFNISYGFDHLPKIFGNKYIIFFWTAWDVRF
ncbi:hypothetical protein M1446_03725 [Candidatus Dependentiae bacterium]|nr:hypothetical protein [Candidatus Dependentiae bacterium]